MTNQNEPTAPVSGQTEIGEQYTPVLEPGLITSDSQFLYAEAAMLDAWRLDDWLALFTPDAVYSIPSPGHLGDDPATTLHLVHDSMTILAGRVRRLKSNHAHAESPRSRTRRQIANVQVWRGPQDLHSRSVFDVVRVRGAGVDRYVGVYEHLLRPTEGEPSRFVIARRRVLLDHNIESAGGQLSILL